MRHVPASNGRRARNTTSASLLTFGVLLATAPAIAAPPEGLLTPFEQQRHDTFVETARSGSIDLLFIGDSTTEFWRQEGSAEWQRNYSGLDAANFGVQGADTKSVLWRLQNGELDGFTAKVIVLDAMWAADLTGGASEAEVLAGNAEIVAEIRRRQPAAKVLLLVTPRLRSTSIQSALNQRFAELADGPSIEYIDLRRAFAGPDGRFDTTMASGRGSALSEKGYATLSAAMQPTLVELMDGV